MQTETELKQTITSTFNRLVFSAKKEKDNYCVHDDQNNCFDTIEDIQDAVALIVAEEKKVWLSQLRKEIEGLETYQFEEGGYPYLKPEDVLNLLQETK